MSQYLTLLNNALEAIQQLNQHQKSTGIYTTYLDNVEENLGMSIRTETHKPKYVAQIWPLNDLSQTIGDIPFKESICDEAENVTYFFENTVKPMGCAGYIQITIHPDGTATTNTVKY